MLPVLKMSTARWWYLLALIIITLDQLSKYWVQANFELYERLPLLSFLDFTLVYNEGAAWSFLSDAGGWQRWLFTAISLGVSVVLVVWMARLQGNLTRQEFDDALPARALRRGLPRRRSGGTGQKL